MAFLFFFNNKPTPHAYRLASGWVRFIDQMHPPASQALNSFFGYLPAFRNRLLAWLWLASCIKAGNFHIQFADQRLVIQIGVSHGCNVDTGKQVTEYIVHFPFRSFCSRLFFVVYCLSTSLIQQIVGSITLSQLTDNSATLVQFCFLHIPEHTHPLIPVELSLQEQQ